MLKNIFFLSLLSCIAFSFLFSQTIEEKKASLTGYDSGLTPETEKALSALNEEQVTLQHELENLYQQTEDLYQEHAPAHMFVDLLEEIRAKKLRIQSLENEWREANAAANQKEEQYALWHQPETTLGQLVNDYGSQDYVYIVSPEISSMPISVNSNLPIPQSSWQEMLEMILTQNGVGIRTLNPYLRELYLIRQNSANVELVTNYRPDLELFPDQALACFVLSPEPSEVKRIWLFLDRFVNPQSTLFQIVGRDLLIIAPIREIRDLLRLYDFVVVNRGTKEYKVVPLARVDAKEMANILETMFTQFSEEPQKLIRKDAGDKVQVDSPPINEGNQLRVLPLENIAQALFLIGTREEINQAEIIIQEVEKQVGEAKEKVIYRYKARHSEAEDLADVLEKTYYLMVETGVGFDNKPQPNGQQSPAQISNPLNDSNVIKTDPPPTYLFSDPFYQDGQYAINPTPIAPGVVKEKDPNKGRVNFIVDSKTSSIIMVVEAEILPKLKELLKQLDVPKRMVQLDVLLFERRLNREENYGLNLLKLGDSASQTRFAGATWNDTEGGVRPGIFDFIFSKPKGSNFPAYDLIYRFLISQQDIQINSNPSVVAINQTPATIKVNEEISLNTGIYNIETTGTTTLKDSFTRAQYGISIVMTPTIHMHDEENFYEDPTDYVSLDLHINFDTPQRGGTPDRPDVFRREVVNQVRVADGQSVIIGGLRGKEAEDIHESIPYLGEIPGLGKLFSTSQVLDRDRDMYIVITPRIVTDPQEDFNRIRLYELCRRPGDTPEFLCKLEKAREKEKNRLFNGWRTFLFGRCKNRCIRSFDRSLPSEDPCPPNACFPCPPRITKAGRYGR